MQLEFTMKSQFGHERFFPVNSLAQALVDIMPRRTAFHRKDLEILKEAGFSIEVKPEEIKV